MVTVTTMGNPWGIGGFRVGGGAPGEVNRVIIYTKFQKSAE